MQLLGSGHLAKMRVKHTDPVSYQLPLDEQLVAMAPLLGRQIRIQYSGQIRCMHCGRQTKKSFNQGYCYPCFRSLAACDSCILNPEKCHFHAGTCREPDWGESHCMVDHVVYLANASGLKVGITRATQVPTRWIDQGAVQALPILRVATRRLSGLVEDLLRQQVADKTNWRALIKGQIQEVDLVASRERLLKEAAAPLRDLQKEHGLQAVQILEGVKEQVFRYPVTRYLQKAVTHNLDKNPLVEGTLLGIRGQYLLLDSGAINIRKYGAYHVQLSAGDLKN